MRIPSVVGRTQYTLVDLVDGPDGLVAYPLGAGSGSVSAFSRADGFLRIPGLFAGRELELLRDAADHVQAEGVAGAKWGRLIAVILVSIAASGGPPAV